ncbi:MAG TPA: four helix bundle suffix domain-containing protein [Verrucomicrobiota bacterium]|jgi:four helix bundle suffix protein|nr:MAG: Topoisomerase DNA binding C4 zinc finger [Verrucomicrobia bacterium ADurb.Bin118]HPY30419.1 four helix bundle suffix domain-containing protein [Verrucomicrobiota bacterium]HQB15844.1 four helix bundle suffix domain-containing protein [Verrucomicrobiota bacterium]
MNDPLLPPHGGYRKLRSFQVAELAYDGTLIFCDRFIEKRSRTHDQMVQAARSGVQNIAEASVASGTSKKTELKLTNVARASLEELMRDFEDFLRQRGLRLWPKDSPEALAVRHRLSDSSDKSDLSNLKTAPPEVAANTMLCLINQASYLLRRQLQRLEQDFLEKGGFTERLYAARTKSRSDQSEKSAPSAPSDAPHTPAAPLCPRCNKPMRRRTARQGPHAGQAFWGCTGYPDCKGTRPC